jgi:hypothetical protein
MTLLKNISTELADYREQDARMYAYTDNPSDLDRYVYPRKLLPHIPSTQPSISTGTITLDCNDNEQAMFEPRESVGTLTITSNYALALSNATNVKIISKIIRVTGTITVTFTTTGSYEFQMPAVPSSITSWVDATKILTITAGTADIIEMSMLRYSSPTLDTFLVKIAEVPD